MEFLASMHPVAVHFPIVLFILYTLFEAAGILLKKDFLSNSAYVILVLAIIASLAAVLTGDQALKIAELINRNNLKAGSSGIPLGIVQKHEDFATITLWYFVALLVIRVVLKVKKKFTGFYKYAVLIIAFAGTLLVLKTGELGGELVYKHGVGTELIKPADSLSARPLK